MSNHLTVALAGNPNIGKTTLLNALTGAKYSVGNWAGVTVEKKEAQFNYKNTSITLVDLPGTYSLSTYSIDESIARNYIVEENPDVVLNIVDASNLERNLYLTLQILELGKPVVIALNMMDAANKKGLHIDIKKLSTLLGIPIIPIVASKKEGLDALLDEVISPSTTVDSPLTYSEPIENLISQVESHLTHLSVPLTVPSRWVALKLLEKDPMITAKLPAELIGAFSHIDLDLVSLTADEKYEFISTIIEDVIQEPDEKKQTVTQKIDHIVTHKWLGIPIFALIMFSIFYFTFTLVGDPLKDLLTVGFDYLSGFIATILASLGIAEWMQSLIVDGILNGVFGVLSFLPNIACLFIALTILEDTGYMARVAFIMDQLMKKIGLNGKAIIPMLLGFGCSVPAIMGTRTLEDEKDRLTSIMINPFISCSARLPIYTLFASAFFPGKEAFVIFSLYFLGIVVALIVAFIFKRTLFKSDESPFIMELPPYHLPSLKNTSSQVWEKVRGFLVKAGTIIFAASAVLWLILNFNFSGPSDISNSIGASIGKLIAPLFAPLGFGTWQAALALITGVTAKEVVVSNMCIIYGIGAGATSEVFASALSSTFTPLSAYSFLVFCLLYVPCIAAIGAIKRETNSIKWTLFAITYQTALAWLIAFVVYTLGNFIF